MKRNGLSFFDRYLSVWVLLCMVLGVTLGRLAPGAVSALGRLEVAHISIPIAVLLWLMIFPMMLKVDFHSIVNAGRHPRGLFVTWFVNWLVKPFTMFAIAYAFFFLVFRRWIAPGLAHDYLAGAVLLGAAPCTAMVFVWSQLTDGNPSYTVVQVATNDLIILVAFAPIVKLLLGVGDVSVPWSTLFASVALFVVIPLVGGALTRLLAMRFRGEEYFHERLVPRLGSLTMFGLLATLVLIFAFQGKVILENPLHILLIAIPLVLQTFLIFLVSWELSHALGLPHDIAAPAGMIGASNFFELAVAVAISLFGTSSPVALATVVGVLVEVPVMLVMVRIANRLGGRGAA